MGRIIGLIGCTCLVIAVLRLANFEHIDDTLKGGVEKSPAAKGQSAREHYRRGKELYLRGRYAEAVTALEAAVASKAGLTAPEHRQAQDYLARSQAKANGLPSVPATFRAQSDEADEEFTPPTRAASGKMEEATRTRVERLMMQAQSALKQGKPTEARKLAQQAVQLSQEAKLKFDSRDVTPAQLLARLDQTAKPSPFGKIQPAGGPLPEDEGIQLTAGEKQPAAAAEDAWEESEEGGQESASDSGAPVELAKKLIASARADVIAGRYDEARTKALQADELDVPWSLFEDQPMLILEEVNRRTESTTYAKSSPERKPAAAANSQQNRAAALTFMAQAREALEAGDLATAEAHAARAQELNVAFKTFDDRPELILQEIAARQTETTDDWATASEDTDAPADDAAIPDAKQRKAQVQALLAQARKAMEAGRIDEARDLAVQADQLKVVFNVFDDRPENVLADIARTVQRPSNESDDGPSDSRGASSTRSEGAQIAARKLATELLKQAQALTQAGKLEEAYLKAQAAAKLNVEEDQLSEHAATLMTQIEKTYGSKPVVRTQTTDPEVQAVGSHGGKGRATNAGLEDAEGSDEFSPVGLSAVELFKRGQAELNQGHRKEAYAAFLAAHQTGQKLDRRRAQSLQDYLRELAPRGKNGVRMAAHQVTEEGAETAVSAEPDLIDTVDQEAKVARDRLRNDVLSAVFKAERLKEKDPEKGLQLIDQTIALVEGSNLEGEPRYTLIRQLQRTRGGLETTITDQQPNLEQKHRNAEVKKKVEIETLSQIRIEQEFAKLVEDYNDLYKQRRFAEAEVIAKKAQELNPREPAAVTMFWKARFARRDADNSKLRNDKEESFFDQLDDVEKSVIVKVGDDKPIHFGDNWNDINERRKGKYHADNRIRTDAELQIEKSLGKRISLHEDQVPLNEVLQKVATLAGFNVYIDDQGLEEEGVFTQTPVSINVEAITVKSALNLLLERYNLAYTTQDEVLKITSRLRQQGDMVARTYPVADLVVPIPSQAMGFAPGMSGIPQNNVYGSMPGTGGGQFSVPPSAVPGQGFPQIGPNADVGPMGLNSGSPRVAPTANNYDFDTLTDLIISTVSPETWEAVGGQASVRHYETTLSLVIRQTQKVHEEIADLLGQLRRLQDLQVTIEVRFVTVSDRFFEQIGIDFDFNVQDTLGSPKTSGTGDPIPNFGTVLLPAMGQAAAGAAAAGAAAAGAAAAGAAANRFFIPDPERSRTNMDKYRSPTVVGLSAPGQFSSDYDVPFRQGSFEVGVPTFGGFNPNAGVQVGFAILSDIEAFFFIQAAQADQRTNLLFAPKVMLFDAQTASVNSSVTRQFVISLIPTVGFFSTGFQPIIQFIPSGIFLSVTAVISADRRYVRLTVFPQFTNITDVFTFSFSGGAGGGGGGQQGQQGQQGGQQGQQGFGGQGFGIGGQQQQGQQQQGQQAQQGGGAGVVTIQQPITEIVTVNTTVSVPDGGTVLLGGVKRLREGRSMAGIPILNKIPYLSRLFKNTGVGRETESLMLMVTPRIIIQEEEEELLGIPTK